jgi:hypothetical protein
VVRQLRCPESELGDDRTDEPAAESEEDLDGDPPCGSAEPMPTR